MRYYVLTLIIWFTICKPSFSAPDIRWFQGSIVMSNTREVLTGEIAIEEKFDLILFKQQGQVEVLKAHRLESVFFYDSLLQMNRTFISIKEEGSSVVNLGLYEVVVKGEVKLIRHLRDYATSSTSLIDDYVYYILNREQLVLLQFFNEQVYADLVIRGGEQLKQYEKINRLNPYHAADAVKLIIEFNKIMRDESHSSSMATL